MEEKLSPEENEAMLRISDKWLNKIFKYELYNSVTEESLNKGINELCKLYGLESPKIILCDSPLAYQKEAISLIGDEGIQNYFGGSFYGDLFNYDLTKMIDVDDAPYLQFLNLVWEEVVPLFISIARGFENPCLEFTQNRLNGIYLNGVFYRYYSNKNLLKNDDSLKEKFNKLFSFLENLFMPVFLEKTELGKVWLVSRYPSHIIRNSQNQLHSLTEYAVKFKDGYGQYYSNGVYIPDELFNKLANKKYTFEEWTKEENEETKSLVLAFYEEKFGGEFVFRFLSEFLKESDSYVDRKEGKYLENTTKGMNLGVYTLFKGVIDENTEIAYVRCYCPSTDRMFFLGVNPENTNAKDAIASLCQIPKKLKDHLISFNRQGEIFSFNFDEFGTKLLKNKELTNEDINDVISLSGDEYFQKIKFEY